MLTNGQRKEWLTVLSVRVPRELKEGLQAYAALLRRTPSSVAHEVLERFLAKKRK